MVKLEKGTLDKGFWTVAQLDEPSIDLLILGYLRFVREALYSTRVSVT